MIFNDDIQNFLRFVSPFTTRHYLDSHVAVFACKLNKIYHGKATSIAARNDTYRNGTGLYETKLSDKMRFEESRNLNATITPISISESHFNHTQARVNFDYSIVCVRKSILFRKWKLNLLQLKKKNEKRKIV